MFAQRLVNGIGRASGNCVCGFRSKDKHPRRRTTGRGGGGGGRAGAQFSGFIENGGIFRLMDAKANRKSDPNSMERSTKDREESTTCRRKRRHRRRPRKRASERASEQASERVSERVSATIAVGRMTESGFALILDDSCLCFCNELI